MPALLPPRTNEDWVEPPAPNLPLIIGPVETTREVADDGRAAELLRAAEFHDPAGPLATYEARFQARGIHYERIEFDGSRRVHYLNEPDSNVIELID